MFVTRMMSLLSGGTPKDLVTTLSKSYMGFVVGGMVLATLSGLHQLGSRGMSFYFSQGWFHTKVTLLIVLYVITVLVGFALKGAKDGQTISRQKGVVLHALCSLILIGIVFLTMLGRNV